MSFAQVKGAPSTEDVWFGVAVTLAAEIIGNGSGVKHEVPA